MSKFVDKINVPQEINENEANLYHVIIVEAGFNQAKLEATFKARTQTYDARSWGVHKDRLKQLGHTNVYILHDPTIKAEPKQNKNKDKNPNANAGNGGQKKKSGNTDPLKARNELIAKAKSLGYTGALNVKNVVLEEFIKNAEAHGENPNANAGNDADTGTENGQNENAGGEQ